MNKSFYDQIEKLLKPGSPRVIESGQGAYFTVSGRKMLNLCSSHYLGLATDDRLKAAAKKAIDEFGIGTGYRTLAGTNVLNTKLEEELAKFKGAEDAIVLPSGYLANCTAIQTIIGKEDIVISDELNHASIIDAVRLSGVQTKFIYKHGDMKHLEEILSNVIASTAKQSPAHGIATSTTSPRNDTSRQPRVLIVTDGVFSMDGDLAPLPQIVKLAEKYGALTMVDDAHGEGVMGRGGRGIVDHFGLQGKVDIEVGTLSKAFSVIGGFIAGKKILINFYKQNARQFLFTSTLTAPDTGALIEAVRILQESESLVSKLHDNSRYLKDKLVELGFDIGQSQTPITPIMLGAEDLARDFAARLFEEGVFASAIVFPMVAQGKARIRLIPSAAHSKEDLDFALKKIDKVGQELKVI